MFLRGCIVLLTSGFCHLAGAEKCLEDWACWEVRQFDNRFEFWISNKKPYVFTASLDVRARNLKDANGQRRRFQATSVLLGNSSTLAMTLYPTSELSRAEYQDIFYWLPGDAKAKHDDELLYEAPFAPGEEYPLVQGFGGGWSHSGASKYAVDFAMPVGTAVHAARGGTVVQAVSHHNRGGSDRSFARYANYVVVLHEDGTTGEYYHLRQHGVNVAIGEEVKAGELIGYSGNTGFSSVPHLHFAVYRPKAMGEFESLPFKFKDGQAVRRQWWW